jgi:hypothetical protein
VQLIRFLAGWRYVKKVFLMYGIKEIADFGVTILVAIIMSDQVLG